MNLKISFLVNVRFIEKNVIFIDKRRYFRTKNGVAFAAE